MNESGSTSTTLKCFKLAAGRLIFSLIAPSRILYKSSMHCEAE